MADHRLVTVLWLGRWVARVGEDHLVPCDGGERPRLAGAPALHARRSGRTGRVALGPAQPHGEVAREDVDATRAELLHEPRIRREIQELDEGETPIAAAARAQVR